MGGRAVSSASSHEHPPFGFSTRMRVDFADTDAGGIVYFGRYGRYLERAIIEYRRAVGLPLLGDPGHLFVVRAVIVGVDSWDDGTPTPMPDAFRSAIEAFEARTH